MTATFTLTGDLEALVGSPVQRSLYIETTTDVTDPTDNIVYERASRVPVSATFSVPGLPAWDPVNHPYDASTPQFGIRVTLGPRSWTFLPPAAGTTIDLSDVVQGSPTPLPDSWSVEDLEVLIDDRIADAGGVGGGGISDAAIADFIGDGASLTRAAGNGIWSQLPAAADKVVFVTPRGNDSNDGKTPKTALATVQAAITALGGPGLIQLGYGGLTTGTTVDVHNTGGITIRGVAAPTAGATPSTSLTFTQAGSGAGIDARSTVGFTLEDVMVLYSNSSFTGRLLDLRDDGTHGNTAFATIRDVFLGGASAIRTANCLADVSNTHSVRFEHVHFRQGADVGLRGKNINTDTCNSITLIGCYFNDNTTAHILNPGDGWVLIGCTWEALHSGAAGAIKCETGFVTNSLTVMGGWSGDVIAAAGGIQFDITGNNISIRTFIGGNTGSTGVKFRNLPGPVAPVGLEVASRFDGTETAIDFTGVAPESYDFSRSSFASNVTTRITGGTFFRAGWETRDDQPIVGIRQRSTVSGRAAFRFQSDMSSTYFYDLGMDLDGGNVKRFGLRDQSRSGTPHVWYATALGSFIVGGGVAALARSATGGFFYLPSMAGTPTGVPATQTGSIALVVDTATPAVWAYVGGSWVNLGGGGGGWIAVDASESVKGILKLATQTQTNTGTDDATAVTPLKLATRLAALLDSTTTLGTSNTVAATQGAVKAYVDAVLDASNAMQFKGGIDCSTNPNYPAASAGWTYKVTVAGKIGGASGPNVEVNDTLVCTVDSTAAGNHATVGANWIILQTNVDGAVVGPSSSTAGNLPTFSGTTGKVIADSGVTVSTDGTLASNSDNKVPTEKAVKTALSPTILDTSSTASSGTLTLPLSAQRTFRRLTAQAAGLTLANPSGSPLDGYSFIVAIRDSGTARGISYGGQWRDQTGLGLPSTTVVGKQTTIGGVWNAAESKVDVYAITTV